MLYFKLVQYLSNAALDSLCDNSINKSSYLFAILFFFSVFSRDDVKITEKIKLRKAQKRKKQKNGKRTHKKADNEPIF